MNLFPPQHHHKSHLRFRCLLILLRIKSGKVVCLFVYFQTIGWLGHSGTCGGKCSKISKHFHTLAKCKAVVLQYYFAPTQYWRGNIVAIIMLCIRWCWVPPLRWVDLSPPLLFGSHKVICSHLQLLMSFFYRDPVDTVVNCQCGSFQQFTTLVNHH